MATKRRKFQSPQQRLHTRESLLAFLETIPESDEGRRKLARAAIAWLDRTGKDKVYFLDG